MPEPITEDVDEDPSWGGGGGEWESGFAVAVDSDNYGAVPDFDMDLEDGGLYGETTVPVIPNAYGDTGMIRSESSIQTAYGAMPTPAGARVVLPPAGAAAQYGAAPEESAEWKMMSQLQTMASEEAEMLRQREAALKLELDRTAEEQKRAAENAERERQARIEAEAEINALKEQMAALLSQTKQLNEKAKEREGEKTERAEKLAKAEEAVQAAADEDARKQAEADAAALREEEEQRVKEAEEAEAALAAAAEQAAKAEKLAALMAEKARAIEEREAKAKAEAEEKARALEAARKKAEDEAAAKKAKLAKLGGGRIKCLSCGKTVYAKEKVATAKHIFHKACFKCKVCKQPLTQQKYYNNKTDYYCAAHYRQARSMFSGANAGTADIRASASDLNQARTTGSRLSQAPGATIPEGDAGAEGAAATPVDAADGADRNNASSPGVGDNAPPASDGADKGDGEAQVDVNSMTADQRANLELQQQRKAATRKLKIGGGRDKCNLCAKTVYAQEKVATSKHIFHKACFKCLECGSQLNAKNHGNFDHLYYCLAHHKQVQDLYGKMDVRADEIDPTVKLAELAANRGIGGEEAAPADEEVAAGGTRSAFDLAAQLDRDGGGFIPLPEGGDSLRRAMSSKRRKKKKEQEEKERREREAEEERIMMAERRKAAIPKLAGSGHEKCLICKKTVYAQERIATAKHVFHKTCFRCAECGQRLNLQNNANFGEHYYCKPHFKQLQSLHGRMDVGADAAAVSTKISVDQLNVRRSVNLSTPPLEANGAGSGLPSTAEDTTTVKSDALAAPSNPMGKKASSKRTKSTRKKSSKVQ